jgi:3-deoxy-manno-octulosonate cytidylyltransferase (CMP-KDO synthetase)
LEEEEDIEILRFLEMGYEVRMIELSNDSIAVDTQEDLEIVRKILKNE